MRTQAEIDQEYTNLCTEYGAVINQTKLLETRLSFIEARWDALQAEAKALKEVKDETSIG